MPQHSSAYLSHLQPLAASNKHNHSLLWRGLLKRNWLKQVDASHQPKDAIDAPIPVFIKQLQQGYRPYHLQQLQKEVMTLQSCQSLAIAPYPSVHARIGIPTLYAASTSQPLHHGLIIEDCVNSYVKESVKNSDLLAPYPYIVMSYHAGDNLKTLITSANFNISVAQKIRIFVQLCQLVQRFHQIGYLHLDLKPSNVIVTNPNAPNPQLIMVDFGLSLAIVVPPTTTPTTQYTAGTPAYMSPERFTGKVPDPRSDYYSLGIIFYELLTGVLPFQAQDFRGWAVAHCQTEVPIISKSIFCHTNNWDSLAYQICQSVLDALLAKHIYHRTNSLMPIISALNCLIK